MIRLVEEDGHIPFRPGICHQLPAHDLLRGWDGLRAASQGQHRVGLQLRAHRVGESSQGQNHEEVRSFYLFNSYLCSEEENC